MLAELPKRRRPDVFTVTTSMWTAMHGITSLRISKPDFLWPTVEEQIEADPLALAGTAGAAK